MATCKKEINDDNLLEVCPADNDQVIILRPNEDTFNIKRTTWAAVKNCLIAPPASHFTVDDPENINVPDVITYPLGGGTTFFSKALIGRRSVIVMVNNGHLPQLATQPDYCTPDFVTGIITRPDTFKAGDSIAVYIL